MYTAEAAAATAATAAILPNEMLAFIDAFAGRFKLLIEF